MNYMTATLHQKLLQWIKDDTIVKFYKSKEWRSLRKQIMSRDKHECQSCKARGRYSKGEMVHHLQAVKDKPLLALDTNNLITLCNSCHNEEHPEKFGSLISESTRFENQELW